MVSGAVCVGSGVHTEVDGGFRKTFKNASTHRLKPEIVYI